MLNNFCHSNSHSNDAIQAFVAFTEVFLVSLDFLGHLKVKSTPVTPILNASFPIFSKILIFSAASLTIATILLCHKCCDNHGRLFPSLCHDLQNCMSLLSDHAGDGIAHKGEKDRQGACTALNNGTNRANMKKQKHFSVKCHFSKMTLIGLIIL